MLSTDLTALGAVQQPLHSPWPSHSQLVVCGGVCEPLPVVCCDTCVQMFVIKNLDTGTQMRIDDFDRLAHIATDPDPANQV